MKQQLANLEKLQELDLVIDQIKKTKLALPQKRAQTETELARIKKDLELKSIAIRELEKTRSQARAALDLSNERLERSTQRLDQIKNAQEYQAVTKEVDQLKKAAQVHQEQLEKLNADWELQTAALKALEVTQSEFTAKHADILHEIEAQMRELDRDIADKDALRKPFIEGVDPKIVTQYNRVRNGRNGVGIVPAVAGRCKGCNLSIPPQAYNMLQKGSDLICCPSCQRLLFLPGA